jgi:acyl-CoA synthetase (AMP-forming)/AMP-acid ligase II
MTISTTVPCQLIDLLRSHPASSPAVVIPEQNITITYGGLIDQVEAVAGQLRGAGVNAGDRVGIALPNGLPTIVSFLAASVAGTAAPLNQAYREDEFRFYLEDTSARVLLLPPDGVEAARKAAGDTVRILTVDMDAQGTVRLEGGNGRASVNAPGLDDTALILHTSGSTGRPKRVPRTSRFRPRTSHARTRSRPTMCRCA